MMLYLSILFWPLFKNLLLILWHFKVRFPNLFCFLYLLLLDYIFWTAENTNILNAELIWLITVKTSKTVYLSSFRHIFLSFYLKMRFEWVWGDCYLWFRTIVITYGLFLLLYDQFLNSLNSLERRKSQIFISLFLENIFLPLCERLGWFQLHGSIRLIYICIVISSSIC